MYDCRMGKSVYSGLKRREREIEKEVREEKRENISEIPSERTARREETFLSPALTGNTIKKIAKVRTTREAGLQVVRA